MASGLAPGCYGRSVTDPPAICPLRPAPAGPLRRAVRYGRNRRHWTRGLGATARAEGRRRRHRADGRPGRDQPAGTARPVRRAHARAQRRADDPQRRDQRGDGEPPQWSIATGGRHVITPGAGRPCRCLTAPTAAPAGPCRWTIPTQARRPRYAPSLADVPRREKARAAGGTVEEAASRSARHGRRAQRGSGSPLSRRPAPFMRTLPGMPAPVRWCGGARQTRSVGPRGAVGRPREAASAERDVEGAPGR